MRKCGAKRDGGGNVLYIFKEMAFVRSAMALFQSPRWRSIRALSKPKRDPKLG